MKKSCNNCRALKSNNSCELQYKTKPVLFDGIKIGAIPIEWCPKPKTINEYIYQISKK